MNSYQYAARQKKVALMVDILVRANFKHAGVLLFEDQDWETLAHAAGTKPPSKETREMVLETLKSYEKPLPRGCDDPIKGF